MNAAHVSRDGQSSSLPASHHRKRPSISQRMFAPPLASRNSKADRSIGSLDQQYHYSRDTCKHRAAQDVSHNAYGLSIQRDEGTNQGSRHSRKPSWSDFVRRASRTAQHAQTKLEPEQVQEGRNEPDSHSRAPRMSFASRSVLPGMTVAGQARFQDPDPDVADQRQQRFNTASEKCDPTYNMCRGSANRESVDSGYGSSNSQPHPKERSALTSWNYLVKSVGWTEMPLAENPEKTREPANASSYWTRIRNVLYASEQPLFPSASTQQCDRQLLTTSSNANPQSGLSREIQTFHNDKAETRERFPQWLSSQREIDARRQSDEREYAQVTETGARNSTSGRTARLVRKFSLTKQQSGSSRIESVNEHDYGRPVYEVGRKPNLSNRRPPDSSFFDESSSTASSEDEQYERRVGPVQLARRLSQSAHPVLSKANERLRVLTESRRARSTARSEQYI
ncbi:hypothetical protein OIV83_000917 [Microbotryomycetes sp. JL201]|nr:hypothetical protein OIV83_000917 [Microbotryomycetes sp. JL201]